MGRVLEYRWWRPRRNIIWFECFSDGSRALLTVERRLIPKISSANGVDNVSQRPPILGLKRALERTYTWSFASLLRGVISGYLTRIGF